MLRTCCKYKAHSLFLILILILILFIPLFASSQNIEERKLFIENEKNTISIFEKNVHSVVNVTNIKLARSWLDFGSIEIPSGAGSGFVWDKAGHIVTNYHVIRNADTFIISFHKDKKQYRAKIVGVEPKKDIAILKLEKRPAKLIPISIGISSNLIVGQKTVAIGNPFGLDNTITQGIVSALDRKIDGIGGVKIHGMIQTDAAINPGNSGGPLLNSGGKLIGMNTLIFSKSGTSAGVGFAVPVDTIKRIVPQIIQHGRVIRPVLGITIFNSYEKRYFGLKEGIVIKAIFPNGPAQKAGLKGIGRDRFGRFHVGDIILRIDNKKVDTLDDIYHVLEKYNIGDTVEITYHRGKKVKKIQLKLGSN